MRKLGKVDKSKTTSIQEITNNCYCRVICKKLLNGKPDSRNYYRNLEIQEQYAHTGTMPQGVDI